MLGQWKSRGVFLSVTWTGVYCIWLTRNGLSHSEIFVLWNINYTHTHAHLFLSVVRRCPNKPTLWTSQVGHCPRRNRLHRGGNVDLCSSAGMWTSVPFFWREFCFKFHFLPSVLFFEESAGNEGSKLKFKMLLITHTRIHLM